VNALWVLTRLRMLEVVRLRSSCFLFFGLPLALFIMVAVIFANGHPFERRRLAVVGEPATLLQPLERFPELHVERDRSLAEAQGKLRAHLVSAVLAGDAAGWHLTVGGRDEIFGQGLRTLLPGTVILEVEPSLRWGFVYYVFPGVIAFSVVMSGLFGLGYYMLRYRQNLFLRKLSTTPLSKATFLAAQILGRSLLGVGQCLLMLGCAHLCFGLPLTLAGSLWTLLVTLLGLLVFLGMGLVLASFIQTEGIIYDAISAVAWPVVLMSEMFFPSDDLPVPLPQLASALPSTQLVRLLREVLLYDQTSLAALAPGLAILLAWGLVTFALGCLLFRWND
jgi:ABC-2 type transport system permease protein